MKIAKCKLNKKTQSTLLEFVLAEVTARTAADLLGIQPNSAALLYRKIRQVIMYHLDQNAIDIFEGKIELDKSYFGGVRKGKRGRGTRGKVAIFSMLKRSGKVYFRIVPGTKTETLMPIIPRKLLQIALFIQIAIVAITLLM